MCARQRSNFSFTKKRSHQEKSPSLSVTRSKLRATCPSRFWRGCAKTRLRLQTIAPLIPPKPRWSGTPRGGPIADDCVFSLFRTRKSPLAFPPSPSPSGRGRGEGKGVTNHSDGEPPQGDQPGARILAGSTSRQPTTLYFTLGERYLSLEQNVLEG